jgi:hypothetical protein
LLKFQNVKICRRGGGATMTRGQKRMDVSACISPAVFRFSHYLESSSRNVILDPVKRRRSIQESLRAETRLKLRDQRRALGLAPAFHCHAIFVVRRGRQRRAKFRTRKSAQPRQCGPADLKKHGICLIPDFQNYK